MTSYEIIVTFYFGGNDFDWGTTSEKVISPSYPKMV